MWFFHSNFLQKSHSEIRLLLTTCASLNCSHAKQIREDLDELEQQAKTTPATGNRRTLPQRDREISRKWQKRVWVWCLRLVVLSLCNHAKPYFLAWWLLAAQAKGPFQDSKELKMNSRIVIFQERLSTLSIRCIKSDKLRQTKCNEFLENFVMKKAEENLFYCLLRYVQAYLIWWLWLFISLYVFQ